MLIERSLSPALAISGYLGTDYHGRDSLHQEQLRSKASILPSYQAILGNMGLSPAISAHLRLERQKTLHSLLSFCLIWFCRPHVSCMVGVGKTGGNDCSLISSWLV